MTSQKRDTMDYIRSSILELDEVLRNCRQHFLYSDEVAQQVSNALNQDALAHSDKLEPDLDHTTTLERLLAAWNFGQRKFSGELDPAFIFDVAVEIDSGNFQWRSNAARVIGVDGEPYIATNPIKIDREIGKLLDKVNDPTEHPVLSAVEFNLYFLLIHPFDDGNGRTARLLGNLFLNHAGYSPAIVKHTERITYLRHIQDASTGFKRRAGQDDMFGERSVGELRFMEYSIDRIKTSAERLIQKVSRLKRYEIEIEPIPGGNQKRSIYGTKKILQNTLNAHGVYGFVEIPRGIANNGILIVTTEASGECLIGTLEKYKNRRNTPIKGYSLTENQ